jgi:hypothetical protein
MTLSQAEFEAILQDNSKTIQGDIVWQSHPQHELLLKFKAEILADLDNYQLSLRGTYNPLIYALSYHLICPPYGRIYGLDLGKAHKNPNGEHVGDKHKHRWSEIYRDKQAYEPKDITASGDNPLKVWQQFCKEAAIRHDGVMRSIPSQQLDLFL